MAGLVEPDPQMKELAAENQALQNKVNELEQLVSHLKKLVIKAWKLGMAGAAPAPAPAPAAR